MFEMFLVGLVLMFAVFVALFIEGVSVWAATIFSKDENDY